MEDILNATLAGGVMIGAASGLFINPAASLCVGLFAGVVSTWGFYYLAGKLQELIGLQDTCGIHNLHGMPGFLGGIFSAIAVSAYASSPLTDPVQISLLTFYNSPYNGRSFYTQGGFQIAGTFLSLALGIIFGLIAGVIVRRRYPYEPGQFYQDSIHFEVPEEQGI